MRYYIQSKSGYFYVGTERFQVGIENAKEYRDFETCKNSAKYLSWRYYMPLCLMSARGMENDNLVCELEIDEKD